MSCAGASKQMRALLEIKSADYIHNDLSSAAFYFKEGVAERLKRDERDGIFLQMMAALVMTAFSLEAYLNFLGSQKVANWNDRMAISGKLKTLCDEFGVAQDETDRPFSTVAELVALRNTLAHGKPQIIDTKIEVIGTHDELMARMRGPKAEWETKVAPEFVETAYDDVEEIWRRLLTAAKIETIETTGRESAGLEFLAFVETDKA